MEVTELFPDIESDDTRVLIEKLKQGRTTDLPEIEKLRQQYYPKNHDVMDTSKRPDRPVYKKDGETIERMQSVNRISVPMQKTIVREAVSFAFGNPLGLKCQPKNDAEKNVLEALKRVFHDNKLLSFNRVIGRELFRSTEVAEYWYVTQKSGSHENYGFPTKLHIKVQRFSPWAGDKLYPYFDEQGDLKAFSRGYVRAITKEEKYTYFETYTDTQMIRWRQNGTDWEVDKNVQHNLGKIPVIYGCQEGPEWEDVQIAIDRLETLLSNFAEIIDYHADPKIFVEGEVTSFLDKGKAGGILQGDPGSKAYYLSWEQSPEAVRLEIETLLRFIFSCTQTPDISFDSVKGMQQISGEALEMLFMDAHLKVQDKREILDAYFQRRINVCLAFIGKIGNMVGTTSSIVIEPEITPYSIGNLKEKIENLTTANGGKPIISQKTAVSLAGIVDNADEEYEQIQKEEQETASMGLFEPTQS